MSEAQQQEARQRIVAAKELLETTKRNLQLVDAQIQLLQRERPGLQLAADVSSEHRAAWFGAEDSEDNENGIDLGANATLADFGPQTPHRGIIRVQEDAAFVCTDILVAWREEGADIGQPLFAEKMEDNSNNLGLRLLDGNTGRSLINGMIEGPLDRDRGIVPFSYLSSIRSGLGANIKNRLFSEFTIPRAGTVRVEVYKLGAVDSVNVTSRAFVSLLGYKVYGA